MKSLIKIAVRKDSQKPKKIPKTAIFIMDKIKQGFLPHLSDKIPHGIAAIVRPIINIPVIHPYLFYLAQLH
jgi:hypothetical protein